MNDDPETPSDPAPTQPASAGVREPSWGCLPSLEELYQYMDGFMDVDRQSAMRSHLSRCGGCDDFYHFHNGLRELIGNRCRSELPRDLPERVFRAITDLR